MAGDNSIEAAGTPPPHPELARLEPLVGEWVAEDQTNDSVLGPGVRVTSAESCSWLDGGYFLVSTYETVFGDEPAQRGVNYWGYDSQTERFRIVFFSKTARSPRKAIVTKERWPATSSPSRVRPAFNTIWTARAGSGPTPTARSPWPGG
jgi:hypothetical protein